MRGYKLFDRNWCSTHGSHDFYNKPFKIGVIYEESGLPHCRQNGFHFCKDLESCFRVYTPDSRNRIAEIKILGEIDSDSNGFYATNKFIIIREIPWREVVDLL